MNEKKTVETTETQETDPVETTKTTETVEKTETETRPVQDHVTAEVKVTETTEQDS